MGWLWAENTACFATFPFLSLALTPALPLALGPASLTLEAAGATGDGAAPSSRRGDCRDQSRQTRLAPQAASCGAIFFAASIRPFTDSTDFKNIWRSAGLRSISTIFSTPAAPITTGTPT